MQNSYEELWSILDFAAPDQLGTIEEWKEFIAGPLRDGQAHDADRKTRNLSRAVARALNTRLLPLHFLRREKHDKRIALALPTKTDHVVFCPLLPAQRAVYERFLAQEVVQRMVRKDEICDCDENMAEPPEKRNRCVSSPRRARILFAECLR